MTIHQRKDDRATSGSTGSDEGKRRPNLSREPNEKLAAALEEAGKMKPRFGSAQELFDALDGEGQK